MGTARYATTWTRRAVLRAGLAGTGTAAAVVTGLGGCAGHDSPTARAPRVPAADENMRAVQAARSQEVALLAALDAAIAHASQRRRPALLERRAVHAVHLEALSGAGRPAEQVVAVTNLTRVLRDSAASLRRAAGATTSGRTAAVLASIAASHQVAVEQPPGTADG